MSQAPVTLFVEDLESLAAALPPGQRLPALESILARGKFSQAPADSANHVRFQLLGIETNGPPPVAALCRIADRGPGQAGGNYWLRADPVTLRADMSRVFMTSCGFADLDQAERHEVTKLARETLGREGISLEESRAGHWLIPLDAPLAFDFVPLYQALGRDLADVLPEGPAASRWKKIMTDFQVELHQSGLNGRRREQGKQEINSLWFWGGGSAPAVGPLPFPALVSDDPVSRGLALQAGVPVREDVDFSTLSEPVLVDCLMHTGDAQQEACGLEGRVRQLLDSPAAKKHGFRLVSGAGRRWDVSTFDRARFWKKRRPLSESFPARDAHG